MEDLRRKRLDVRTQLFQIFFRAADVYAELSFFGGIGPACDRAVDIPQPSRLDALRKLRHPVVR
jgi:hypothetical protein